MENAQSILYLLEELTGQCAPITSLISESDLSKVFSNNGIGYSQFNELLLTLGYDRVEKVFFNFIAIDDEYQLNEETIHSTVKIESASQLERGVQRLQKYALLLYGNIKYGFKILSSKGNQLLEIIQKNQPLSENHYVNRHLPILNIQKIPPDKTYYLGYIIQGEIKEKLTKNKNDPIAIEENRKCLEIIEIGKRNNNAYLASDHLDVYIATSMRLRHEFLFINRLADDIFRHDALKDLNLRWFDPTQAYCENRIDKGLAEGLMLRRAKCTIYLAQETDTLGKDSELASTLAQGKPVIAYIPKVDDSFFNRYFDDLKLLYSQYSEMDIVNEQLKIFNPNLAWENNNVREWLTSPNVNGLINMKKLLQDTISKHYDSRAATLCDKHPLGIQVNISTGVANGVLVVRSVENCAKLVKSIILQKMEFLIEKRENNGKKYYYLREKISGCIYRVVTGDVLLTNSFWNFYLQ